ncbi:hypothetical protein Bbelb_136460 [Branchiostoma belcheri]|nr:hypothetical protein Bbelb_136460 [Branchiostoma belcheri]
MLYLWGLEGDCVITRDENAHGQTPNAPRRHGRRVRQADPNICLGIRICDTVAFLPKAARHAHTLLRRCECRKCDSLHVPSPAAGSLDDILNCAEEITNCTAPALQTITRIFAPGAPQPGEAELRQLCQLYPEMDKCVKDASRTVECMATGQDQYEQYKSQASSEPPEVCEEYTSVAARCRLCVDVLFGALLTALLVGWRG